MNEPRQKICATVGSTGCYLLCVVHLAEGALRERLDSIVIYLDALANKYIKEDCYVLEPAALMAMMVPGRWTMMKVEAGRVTQPGELEVLRFERATTLTTFAHFVVGDGAGGVAWDPLGDSLSVSQGKMVSKRIFKRL